MLAWARALAPAGTRVSVLAGKSVGVRYWAGAATLSVVGDPSAAAGAVVSGVSVWAAAGAVGPVFVGGGSSCPPGSMLRGSVG
ncbi:hypothetical protein OKHIL_76440 [Mycolicibacterium mageritense]|nr:hypothetical protein MTY414_74380 [Mycolicibacterium mageritense]